LRRGQTGTYRIVSSDGEKYRAFIPSPLPPDPPLRIERDLQYENDRALLSLGRLDSVTTLLPDPELFLYMYVRKEAVLSAQIEGTQSSLSDLLLFESDGEPGVPLDDIREVSNYVAALDHGLKRLRGGFPLSLRLLREIHSVLLSKGRGSKRSPGEFRKTQNWVGGTRPGNALFVPPPPDVLIECLGTFEKFLHDHPARMPLLVKAGLAHVQFETIHPFLDGNGRLGRLLISLLLFNEGVLQQPILYLSLYLKQQRDEYYRLLQAVRTEGTWEEWLEFFIGGLRQTADQCVQTARSLAAMFQRDRDKIQRLGKAAGSALRVYEVLKRRPIVSIGKAAAAANLSIPTVAKSLGHLETMGIVRETTQKSRGRRYVYGDYIALLNEGTEPRKQGAGSRER